MGATIKHPYRGAFPVGFGLAGLFLAVALLTGALSWFDVANLQAVALVSGFSALFWLLVMLITWMVGLGQIRRVTQFLASDRPLLRWTYSIPEWEAIKEARRQEAQGDWKVALGCLTILFAIAGLLTGLLIGLDEGLPEGLLGALSGALIGGSIGGALGIVVGGGNALTAWRAYREEQPEQVVLGASEIYANESYFKSDGQYRTIRQVRLETTDTGTQLVVDLVNPKVRGSAEETWDIVVPSRLLSEVECVLPRIVVTADTIAEEV